MTQFLASRSMENFFINPTMSIDTSMETFARISIVTEPSTKVKFEDFPLSEGPKEGRLSRSPSTIQDLFITSNLLASYHSEEESASPTDSSDDSASIHSYTETPVLDTLTSIELKTPAEPATALDLFLKPEELAQSCKQIEHRCNRAQAVLLTPVGKPKVIAVPKLVDTPRKRRSNETLRTNPSTIESTRRTISRRSTNKSTHSAAPSTTDTEPALPQQPEPEGRTTAQSTPSRAAPVEVNERASGESVRLSRPNVALLRAKTAFEPFPRLNDFAISSPTRSKRSLKSMDVARENTNQEEITATPATPARKRLHKLASSFSLSNAGDMLRRTGSIASMKKFSNTLTLQGPGSVEAAQKSPPPPIPRRSSSMGRLTPRGAAERAPVLVLPPFSDEENENDDDDDDDFATVSPSEALKKWDRPVASRQASRIQMTRPSIDGVVAGTT